MCHVSILIVPLLSPCTWAHAREGKEGGGLLAADIFSSSGGLDSPHPTEDGFDHTMEESGVSFQASSSSPVASPPSVERKTDAKLAPLSSTSTSGPLGKLPPLTGPPSRGV